MIYGYIRVSSDRQTVENQRFEINKFCERNKLVIDGWIEVILCFVLIVTISLYDEKSSEFGCFDVLSAKYPQNLRNFFMILPLSLIKLQKIMISKTYLRYIWLLDTIIGSRESLTYDHIVRMWKGSPYAYMGGLPIRTFHEHRKGIEEMFGVIIECDKSKGYTYYIKNPEVLKQNSYAQLLLRKYSVPQDFSTFNMMRNRILLEEIPHGTAYFDDVVESMRTNTELIIDYQRYEGKRETLTMQPYSMKVYDRRWYVLGP